jgi:hypothetical protein
LTSGPIVNAIDRQVLDLAANIDVNQLDAPHQRSFQIDRAELGVAQVDGAKLRATQVNAFEARATEIGTVEVRHVHDANCSRRRLSGQRPSAGPRSDTSAVTA